MALFNAYYTNRKLQVEARGPSDARQIAVRELGVQDRYEALVTIIRADQDDSEQVEAPSNAKTGE